MSRPPDIPSPSAPGGRRLAIRLALFYGAFFLVIGCYMPYLPVWLKARGMGAIEIGVLLTAPLFGRMLFAPLIAFLADRSGNRRRFLIALAWGALASFGLLHYASGFAQLLGVIVLFSVFWSPITPLSEAVAMTGVRNQGIDYGRVRLWGSLTFVIASLGGGFAVGRYGPEAAYWIMLVSAAMIVGAAYLLPRPAARETLEEAGEISAIRPRDAFALMRSPSFLLFLFAAGTVQAGHAVYYVFGTLHWQGRGISEESIGALWAIGVVAEIMLFACSARALAAFGPVRLIGIAGLAGVVRWVGLALDPSLAVLFALQALHGLSFGAAHLGAIHFIGAAASEDRAATAQGLYASIVAGLAMAVSMAAAGPLYTALHGHAYLVMAALSGASCIGTILLMRRWSGERLGARRLQPQSAGTGGAMRQPS